MISLYIHTYTNVFFDKKIVHLMFRFKNHNVLQGFYSYNGQYTMQEYYTNINKL